MLRLFNSADVSFILILALVFYPVMDFLMALIRRLKNRTPLMEPDSEHFHNLLYAFYKKQSDNPVLANSLTGVTIVAIWPGIPVAMIYLGVAPAGQAWNYLFLADFIIFLSLYPLLRGAASNNG
jgi:UDP-N-acetylmuramyl pentapeptide phosphotransferase/UDP-N-acetylglucosamine-1-phosphate transferase